MTPLLLDTYFLFVFLSLLFCFSHGQIQSAGHGQLTPFSLCSDLFQMPLADLALISTIKTFPLTTPWNEHTQTPNSQHEGDFINLEGGGLPLGQGTASGSGGLSLDQETVSGPVGSFWVRGLLLNQGALSGSGGCLWIRWLPLGQGGGCWLWNRGLLLDQAKTAAGATDEVLFKEKERSLC